MIVGRVMGNYKKTSTILQMETSECGAASLGMILKYYGHAVPLEELRVATGVSRNGCNAKNIILAARNYGLKADAYKRELGELAGLKTPCILYWGFSHFVVFEGKKGRYYYINDPAYGRRRVDENEMSREFTGISLEFSPDTIKPKRVREKSILRISWNRMKAETITIVPLILFGICSVLPGLMVPAMSQVFVDEVLLYDESYWINIILIGFLAAVVMHVIFMGARYILLSRLQLKVSYFSTYSFLDKLMSLPIFFFEQRMPGELSLRTKNNDVASGFFSGEYLDILLDTIIAAVYLLLMFYYSPTMAAITLGVRIVGLLIERLLNNRLHEHTMRWQNEDANVTGVLNNGLRIISSLRAAGAEEVYVERLLGRSATEMRAASDRQKTTEYLHSIPVVVDAIVLMTNLLVGGWLVMTSEYSVGYLVAFIMLESLFAGPFDHLVRLSGVRELLRTHLTRIDDIINYPSDKEGVVYADMPDERLSGDVEFKNITFGYSRVDEPVIKDFSLRIPAGKTVAIVGNTGSGKSTLSKLLLGLHHPAEGEVCVDGVSVREIPEDIMAVSVAGVSQETTLFPGTIRDNITLWNPDISDREVIDASKKACINLEILRRSGGYDYLVNEGGNNLSGGQKQRIQIARALVTHPSVLVMDEATSALDAVVEEKVMNNIMSIGCTCIVIAHRLSTVRDCDEIVVLNDGRIAEHGTHEELIEKKGLYFDMVSTKEA